MVAKSLSQWRLGDAVDDPTITLLRQITQTRHRCDYYADLLHQQVDEADGNGNQFQHPGPAIPKWVAGLIGHKYAAAGKDGVIYASEEGVRALVSLEQSERKILTEQCKAAISAGLTERMVQIAEQQGAMLVTAVKLMVAQAIDAGMPEQWAEVIYDYAPQALREIAMQGGLEE
jgi:uncharacterized Ntn-hydrolase superfamily protein